MSVKTKIPTSHINDYDVADTLNANDGKVGAWEDMFKAAANINPDSKHKPIVLDVRFCQDFDSSKKHYLKDWWKGPDGLCGYNLAKAKANGWTALISKYDGKKNGWEYVPPYGQGTPLRPNDFAGYYPAAQPIVQGFYVQKEVSNDSTSVECQIAHTGYNNDSLTWADFDVLKNYYFGVMLRKNDGTTYIRFTATQTLGESTGKTAADGSFMPKFDASVLSPGSYTAYPFISSRALTQADSSSNQNDVIYTLPNVNPVAVEIVLGSIIVTFSPLFTYTAGSGTSGNIDSILLSLRVVNESSSTIRFTGNLADVRYKSSDPSSPSSGSEKIGVALADFEVGAGATNVNLGTITGVNVNMRNNCKVYVTLKHETKIYSVSAEPLYSGSPSPIDE